MGTYRQWMDTISSSRHLPIDVFWEEFFSRLPLHAQVNLVHFYWKISITEEEVLRLVIHDPPPFFIKHIIRLICMDTWSRYSTFVIAHHWHFIFYNTIIFINIPLRLIPIHQPPYNYIRNKCYNRQKRLPTLPYVERTT